MARPHTVRSHKRDIDNLCGHFGRYGVYADGRRIANGLWNRFIRFDL